VHTACRSAVISQGQLGWKGRFSALTRSHEVAYRLQQRRSRLVQVPDERDALLPAREKSRSLQGLNFRSPGLSLAGFDSCRRCYQMAVVQSESIKSDAETCWMWITFHWAPSQRGAQVPRLAGAVEVENA